MSEMRIISLGNYKGIQLEIPRIHIAAEEIDQMILEMLWKHVTFQSISDRTVQIGDRITVDMIGTLDNEFSEDYSIHSHQMIAGKEMAPLFDDHLIGLHIGEEIKVSMDFPENYEDSDAAGKTLTVTAVVHTIEEPILPELTDEFCKEYLHCATVKDYRDVLEEELMEDKAIRQQNECMYRLLDAVRKASEFDIPENELQKTMIANGYKSREIARMEIESKLVLMEIAKEECYTQITDDPNQLSMMAIQTIYNNAVIRTI